MYWYAEFNLFGKDKEINSLGFFPWCFIKTSIKSSAEYALMKLYGAFDCCSVENLVLMHVNHVATIKDVEVPPPAPWNKQLNKFLQKKPFVFILASYVEFLE